MEWDWASLTRPVRHPSQGQPIEPRNPPSGIKQEGWAWETIKIDGKGRLSSKGEAIGIGHLLREENYRCGFCKGTGEKPRGSKCSACKGKKLVPLNPPVMVCAYCKGRGEERPRTNITCLVCRGLGFVSVQEPLERCSRCRGKGKEPHNKLPCIRCRGKGVTTIKEKA